MCSGYPDNDRLLVLFIRRHRSMCEQTFFGEAQNTAHGILPRTIDSAFKLVLIKLNWNTLNHSEYYRSLHNKMCVFAWA